MPGHLAAPAALIALALPLALAACAGRPRSDVPPNRVLDARLTSLLRDTAPKLTLHKLTAADVQSPHAPEPIEKGSRLVDASHAGLAGLTLDFNADGRLIGWKRTVTEPKLAYTVAADTTGEHGATHYYGYVSDHGGHTVHHVDFNADLTIKPAAP